MGVFGKRTDWLLIYFLIYAYLNILAKSQILSNSLYFPISFAANTDLGYISDRSEKERFFCRKSNLILLPMITTQILNEMGKLVNHNTPYFYQIGEPNQCQLLLVWFSLK